MRNQGIHILWDCSHLWGLMALRGIAALGLPCKLVSAEEIAQGSLLRNPPQVLLVPGGNAYQKEARLGPYGMQAIRHWVANGGFYLGFCGGAGLALTHTHKGKGLRLCQWTRHNFREQLYHMISGHVMARNANGLFRAPVWWPGRFETGCPETIHVLATYQNLTDDLWLADMPVCAIPPSIRSIWDASGQLAKDLRIPANHPLAIHGRYGKGQYILSYAHLETPASNDANLWLASLLEEYCGLKPIRALIPPWSTTPKDPESNSNIGLKEIDYFHNRLYSLLCLSQKMGLHFPRTSWLWGWHPGAPGINLSHLLACASFLVEKNASTSRAWQMSRDRFMKLAEEFLTRAENFIWTCRLKQLTDPNESQHAQSALPREKYSIFGHPMHGKGLANILLHYLEPIIYFSQSQQP